MKTIYNKYKERFIEISGKNRSLFLKNIVKKYSYDIGAVLENTDCEDFYAFLWHKKRSFVLLNDKSIKRIASSSANLSNSSKENSSEASVLSKSLADLKYLMREVEELEKETGRYELFVGYPFVIGTIKSDIQVKGPLLFFPVLLEIDKDATILSHVPNQPIIINKSLILAYTKEHNIKSDSIIQEFDPQNEDSFQNAYDVIDYLNKQGFKLRCLKRKTLIPFDTSFEVKSEGLEIKNMAVLGRFPLANAIYNDYLMLENKNLSSPAIEMLLQGTQAKTTKKSKKEKKRVPIVVPQYEINDLDFAQENAIEQINRQDNIVIYGPPGTGKSQTIVNIISDALCKNKRVLVVSQKRAALDVVFSRLGKLNAKAMLLPDPEKDKVAFFDRIKQMHALTLVNDSYENQQKYQNCEIDINHEIAELQTISDTLFTKTEFGLTLQEMYALSYNIGRDTKDYAFYEALKKTSIINYNYDTLSRYIKLIADKNLAKLYLVRRDLVTKNPMVLHIATDLDMHKLKEASSLLNTIISEEPDPFDFSKLPHSRYLSTFYLENSASSRKSITRVAKIITDIEHPKLAKWLSASAFPLLWPVFPFLKARYDTIFQDVIIDLNIAQNSFKEFEVHYAQLKNVLDAEGYALAISGLLNGNISFIKKLLQALENYVTVRDMNLAFLELSADVREILDFAYNQSEKTPESLQRILNSIVPIRIYHEIVKNNTYIESRLSKTVSFDSLRERILNLKADQRELTKILAMDKFSYAYAEQFNSSPQSKDYLYQIQKQRALWPIRRMIEYFENFLFNLFPCWLLSPQAVSTIFPLKPDMFDLVVFDEASQIFIEAALPTIYRGKRIVVAGDNKQLRPTSGFVKRYMGDDSFDYNMDLSTQAALEVESLLDLATAKYYPVNLTYHYRSRSAELIDFSNVAFYDNKLQIAPNISIDSAHPPIERIKVKGSWQNRHNQEEAVAVVKLVRSIFKDRLYNESLGIVTFNIEQKEYIEDMLDAEADKSPSFRKQYNNERNRIIDGENASIFVKNLENVQGDERDIIIFSVGYAKNNYDKIVAQFGSLSMEGGENRLNVAITRAKKKVYIVTSIEPEELDRSETTKNNGPKLLKKYLQYARAVSEQKPDEVRQILASFSLKEKRASELIGAYEEQIKEALEKMGYVVNTNLGNTDYKLSLGVFDKGLGRYVLGIECDYQAYNSSDSILERDVYRIKFLESRGWKIMRVWSRDWWLNKNKVLEKIVTAIEIERELINRAKDD